ncbi:serine/threonine protein kinase [Nonomuraea wenchangensis]
MYLSRHCELDEIEASLCSAVTSAYLPCLFFERRPVASQVQPTPVWLPLNAEDPHQIGPYRLVGRLGTGGMGIVFAGVDSHGIRAAVKVVHASLSSDEEFRARFAREISVLGRVRGACVARILASDANAPQPWLAAEYVPGPTLEGRVRSNGTLQGDELYGLAAGLAEAMVAVHVEGIVHRDIKPSNVILAPTGPKLVDFGIARVLDATVVTRTGAFIGSPGWVSPEEYSDVPAGPAADIYGWGLLVVYAATGLPAYGVARPEVLALRVLRDEVDTSAVPRPLRGLVDRALAKAPSLRPSAQEVMSMVAAAWRGHHGESLITQADAAYDITARLDRTWVMHAWDTPWPADHGPVPAVRGRAKIVASVSVAVLALLGAGTAVALNVIPETTDPSVLQLNPATTPTSAAVTSEAVVSPMSDQSGTPKPTSSPAQAPPGTSAELAAALDLALANTPAAAFTFEGGFTQSISGGRASGRVLNHESQDDLDMRIRPYDSLEERYIVLRSSSLYRNVPRAKVEDLLTLQPSDSNWYALMVAGMAGPPTVREVVAHGTRMKRKGRIYTGTLAVDNTNGLLRSLLSSWLGGDIADVSPDSYITYKLTIDVDDRPMKFVVAWCVPVGNGGIYKSVFTTMYRNWTSAGTVSRP